VDDPVEQIVARFDATYPTLFGRPPWSRWYIFDQLFFVVGGGFAWQCGELVDRFGVISGSAEEAEGYLLALQILSLRIQCRSMR